MIFYQYSHAGNLLDSSKWKSFPPAPALSAAPPAIFSTLIFHASYESEGKCKKSYEHKLWYRFSLKYSLLIWKFSNSFFLLSWIIFYQLWALVYLNSLSGRSTLSNSWLLQTDNTGKTHKQIFSIQSLTWRRAYCAKTKYTKTKMADIFIKK